MKGIFITGTDTGVGKTIMTGLLNRFLRKKKRSVITQKWIQTGTDDNPPELKIHPYPAVYSFKFPASPHLAARLEKRKINKEKIKKAYKNILKIHDFVLVEGIGGVLVPFNGKDLVIDIAKDLKLPCVIVVGNKLGAINHTLLTIEALKRRKIKILGIVFNNCLKGQSGAILKNNTKIIKALSGEKILGIIPYTENLNTLYRDFTKIGKKIYRAIK